MVKPVAGYRPLAYSSPEPVQTTGTVAELSARTQCCAAALAFERRAVRPPKYQRTRHGLHRAGAASQILACVFRVRFQKIKEAAPDQTFRRSVESPSKPVVRSDDRAARLEYHNK